MFVWIAMHNCRYLMTRAVLYEVDFWYTRPRKLKIHLDPSLLRRCIQSLLKWKLTANPKADLQSEVEDEV